MEAIGANPLSSIALRMFVDAAEPHTNAVIQDGLSRCAREIGGNGYAPTLTIKDFLDRCGVVSQKDVDEAECRAAWDALLRYADKHIVADVEGRYGPRHYFGQVTVTPELEQRTSDSLRRVGGWPAIKTMTMDDYPFVQKRFYEEYRAWQATESALIRGALAGNQAFKSLCALPEPKTKGELRAQVKQLEAK